MKIVMIGIGSFTFGPSVLSQALAENVLANLELVLVDLDREMAELMAAVARRMATPANRNVKIFATTDRVSALDGADFVVCSASPAMQRRFEKDCQIIAQFLPGHQPTEFGGIAGLSNSLCQIHFISQLAHDMKKFCPGATLLNVANPLPRVCQAAHESGVHTIGFCCASLGAYADLWQRFMGQKCPYPFSEPRTAWKLTLAGVNHFVWMLEMRDRNTGEDLLPRLHESLRDAGKVINPRCENLARQTGYLLLPCDDHCRDFLDASNFPVHLAPPWHGNPDERKLRRQLLNDVAVGKESWTKLNEHPSWERPMDVVAALGGSKQVEFESLNLINTDGQIDNLPRHVFVETPAKVSSAGIVAQHVSLPSTVLPYAARTALVTDTIVRAAMNAQIGLVDLAVEMDPTISDKNAGKQALRACIEAHREFMPSFTHSSNR